MRSASARCGTDAGCVGIAILAFSLPLFPIAQCYAPKLVLDEELQERGGRGEAPDGRISPPDLEVPTFSSNRHTRPPLTRLPVAWLRPLMALDEEAVVQYSGLDAAVLLRVFDMARAPRRQPPRRRTPPRPRGCNKRTRNLLQILRNGL